jgi:hypothetical protein
VEKLPNRRPEIGGIIEDLCISIRSFPQAYEVESDRIRSNAEVPEKPLKKRKSALFFSLGMLRKREIFQQ